jgi:RecB family exonuclease
VPYQTVDALPLAAEPYAAALDLVFDFVASGFSRGPTIALLRSPHFAFVPGDEPLDRRAIARLDRKLGDAGYLGGFEQLRDLVDPCATARKEAEQLTPALNTVATATLAIARELVPLLEPAPASRHLDTLQAFLRAHDRPSSSEDVSPDRRLRGRAAIHAAIESLRGAHRRIDDRTVEFAEVVLMLRRWIEGQTFAPRASARGVHLIDAQAARFGSFDDVHVLGLIDTDWPDRTPRNIFFPPLLLQQHFRWPAESDRLRAARGAFRDLLRLPHRRVSLSTFVLEDEGVVGPSVFLEDLETAGLNLVRLDAATRLRVFPFEALSEEPVAEAPLSTSARTWLSLRRSRTDRSAPIFHGKAGSPGRPAYAVGALETYLECPFKFFAKHVLRLDEEQQDEDAKRPRLQGIFLHRVFQAFFEEWGRIGQGAITLDNLAEAREVFGQVVEPLLADLPAADAALERNRLCGSAAAEGLADIVFRIEAEWGADVVERLLEHRVDGEFEIHGGAGSRRIALTGVADRIDLLADGTLRVIDYKSSRPPSVRRMLQLPVYSVCASQQLDGRHGRSWTVGDGGYIAFKDARRFVPLAERGALDQVLQDAQARLLGAIDEIERGEFPPTPIEPFRCTFCGYSGVCRKDYVGDE